MNQSTKTALIIGGVILAIFLVLPLLWGALSGWPGGGWGMMGPGMMGGFGWGWLMPIFPILTLGLIIWGVLALFGGLAGTASSDSASSRTDSALEVLKKRYARGEISKEEYEEKKRDLT